MQSNPVESPENNDHQLEAFRKFSYPLCQSHKRFNKVFGIGANKTGSTSLQLVFHILGLRVGPQFEGELTANLLSQGKIEALKSYVAKYDAFQDVPFASKSTYAQVDALFQNSKFILTYREPETWFRSFLNHQRKYLNLIADTHTIRPEDLEGKDYLYDGFRKFKFESDWLIDIDADYKISKNWDLSFKKDHFINLYIQRNKEIARHFSERPDDLLVIDITKEKNTKKIVDFLELPSKLVTAMPHLNKT